MAALEDDKNLAIRGGDLFTAPAKAGVKLFAGCIVVLSGAVAKPAVTAAGLRVLGICDDYVDNTAGEDGDVDVKYRRGVYRLENSEDGDEITLADVGNTAFLVDDQTVAKTSDTGARSPAGFIVDVDDDGVWVLLGHGPVASAAGSLLVANNLSDATPATARANIGANKVVLSVLVSTLIGAGVTRLVSPVAGTIKKIWSVIDGALATGDATLTAAIGATPVTDGALTITQAASAAGDVDSATPSAARTVIAGDVIKLTLGGTNSAARTAAVAIEIET